MKNRNLIITNNNPKQIQVGIKYDEKFNVYRINVKLKKRKSTGGK